MTDSIYLHHPWGYQQLDNGPGLTIIPAIDFAKSVKGIC